MMNMPMTKQHPMPKECVDTGQVLDNQQGSVIVLVLLVLTIMTVLGIVSSDSVVTENFIVRNVGIHQHGRRVTDRGDRFPSGKHLFDQRDGGHIFG